MVRRRVMNRADRIVGKASGVINLKRKANSKMDKQQRRQVKRFNQILGPEMFRCKQNY